MAVMVSGPHAAVTVSGPHAAVTVSGPHAAVTVSARHAAPVDPAGSMLLSQSSSGMLCNISA